MNVCGFGIFELAKIKAAIGVLSVVHLDTVSTAIGEPVIPSYVPGPYSKYGDGMNFIERAKNLLGVVLGQTTFVKVYHSETEAFRKNYARNAKRLSEMLLNQPVSAKQLLIRHCEFTAKFGRMPNLDPYGRQLSFVQYYLIDVALAVISIFIVVICICVFIVRRCCSATVKSKKD
ncbi:hypothetical protein OESDEN_16618 [Oesophagostomum dentatum]|uniref:glucuronosyltransferase n=1 Tax=Oesophagostomum dentatum TaxID=61180 RepID=A0A0B1SII4_OESDE|nr:hypothetical protein OESDEN_16618 [Oesophagostomum dentatum]